MKLEDNGAADMAHRAHMHQMERNEAALVAVMAHMGWTLDMVANTPERRARVVQTCRETSTYRGMGDVREVALDGVTVWRGWWRWRDDAPIAEWREESLTTWMKEALK